MTYKEFATLTTEKLFAELKCGPDGLSSVVAEDRRKAGENRIVRPPSSVWAILWRQLRSPMVLVLLAAFIVSAATGDIGSAITILVFTLLNTVLGFVQEHRSEHVIEKLNAYIASMVAVRRNGAWIRIPKEQIVPGDVVRMEPGDAFPADLRITRSVGAIVDESVLTGESIQVPKHDTPMVQEPGMPGDALNIGFAGTVLAAGTIEGVVFATGDRSTLGGIARMTSEVKRESIFEKNISSFTRFIVKLVTITLTVVYIANLIIKGRDAHPAELLLFSLALAVSVIPEALPAVMTITFSRGALDLAKKKVVLRRLSAIEDLGHIEVLCTDKTGTITENNLVVGRMSCVDTNACLRAALFASDVPDSHEHGISSFDAAIWKFASEDGRHEASAVTRYADLPFDPERRRNSTVVEDGGRRVLTVKGAPEDILDLSGVVGADRERVLTEFAEMGKEGMRVLALGQREVGVKEEYGTPDESGLRFLGLIGFIDPLKSTAKDAITLAEQLHVRVKIVTGDSLEVATAVGLKVGIIDSPADAIGGAALAALSEIEFEAAVEKYDVFARITPELKYRIVGALKAKFVTGFLGEGINDAPALKLANVAIVVAGAADVAREAADVVLLDKSLDVVVDGIRAGRTIFANVLKYIKFTLVGNFGNFYSIAVISLFLDFLPLTPEQILLTNLLTDFPMIAVATDWVDTAELANPRRFNVRDLALYTTVLGLVSSVFDFIYFGVFRHLPEQQLQTMWYFESVLTELVLIFSLRTVGPVFKSRRASSLLTGLALATAAITIALPYTDFGARVFHFARPTLTQLAIIGVIVTAYFFTTEAAKLAYHRFWGKLGLANGKS